ncbi:MAG: MopE-related protein, partial [Myxococcota bacterium]|nr:MopE-related protein [Myxococcota bacterium]
YTYQDHVAGVQRVLGQSCYGYGSCGIGVVMCAGPSAANCSTNPGMPNDNSTAETCNALDDDCDGLVDEASNGGALTQTCYTGPGGTLNVGVCTSGLRTCASGQYSACIGEVTPASNDMSCDGQDQDCSGSADEDYVATGCGSGACASTSTCVNGVEQACIPVVPSPDDQCDGNDNDCDGSTDEHYTPVTCGQGVCAATSACIASGGEEQDIFNGSQLVGGYDWNWSRTIDNSEHVENGPFVPGAYIWNWTHPSYANHPTYSTWNPWVIKLDASMASVVVHTFRMLCLPVFCPRDFILHLSTDGGATYTPHVMASGGINNVEWQDFPVPETAGITHVKFELVTATPAYWWGYRAYIYEMDLIGGGASSAGAFEQPCTPLSPTMSNEADNCDNLDNDCDGLTDEDFVGGSSACGVGACAAVGAITCVAGDLIDGCAPGPAGDSDATCDGIDDDCDG